MLGKIEGRRRGQQRMRWLDGFPDAMDMKLGQLQEMVRTGKPGVLQSMRSWRVGHDLMIEQQQESSKWLRGNEPAYNAGDTGDSGLNSEFGRSCLEEELAPHSSK